MALAPVLLVGGSSKNSMADFPPTRASLLVRLRDPKDEAAWRQFVDLYAPLVYGYARKQGLQDADAADLSQHILATLVGALGRLEYDPERGAFRNWLFTVVRRKLINWRASQNGRQNGCGDNATHALLEQLPAAEDPEVLWEAEWQRRVFAWACEKVRAEVSSPTWQAFWGTAVEGRPGKEVAAHLNMSVAAVYLARGRVLARLKDCVRSIEDR
jgi:RNA polymerase sigma factor (sigma-70 family)